MLMNMHQIFKLQMGNIVNLFPLKLDRIHQKSLQSDRIRIKLEASLENMVAFFDEEVSNYKLM